MQNHGNVTCSSIDGFIFKKIEKPLIIKGVGSWRKSGFKIVLFGNLRKSHPCPQSTNMTMCSLSAFCVVLHILWRVVDGDKNI